MRYALPDGKRTNSEARRLREWGRLVKRIEKNYPVVVIGYDPGFLLRPRSGNGNGFDIPAWFAVEITRESHD